MRPVVIVPGLGGSVLVRRGKEHRRVGLRSILDNRWMNLAPMSPRRMREWDRDMGYTYDEANRRLAGHDADVVPHGADGGLDGIRNLVPELALVPAFYRDIIDRAYNASYCNALCETLLERGHRERETLIGFPYDFRIVLDPACRAATFARLRAAVEAATAAAGGGPDGAAVLVCHSVGAVLAKWFLAEQGPAWIDRHVHHVVTANAPWGGIPASVRAIVNGAHYWPAFARAFREHARVNSAIVMCLPNRLAFAADEPLLRVRGGETITRASFGAHENVGFRMHAQLFEPHLDAVHGRMASGGARITVATSSAGAVPSAFECRDENHYAAALSTEPGDGTVPARSLHAHGPLFDADAVDRVHMRDVGHSAIMRDPVLIELISNLSNV